MDKNPVVFEDTGTPAFRNLMLWTLELVLTGLRQDDPEWKALLKDEEAVKEAADFIVRNQDVEAVASALYTGDKAWLKASLESRL